MSSSAPSSSHPPLGCCPEFSPRREALPEPTPPITTSRSMSPLALRAPACGPWQLPQHPEPAGQRGLCGALSPAWNALHPGLPRLVFLPLPPHSCWVPDPESVSLSPNACSSPKALQRGVCHSPSFIHNSTALGVQVNFELFCRCLRDVIFFKCTF